MKAIEYSSGYLRTAYYLRIKVVSACHNCGQEFVGTVCCPSTQWAAVSEEAHNKIKTCPVCKARILRKEEYSVWEAGGNVASLRAQLKEKIARVESEETRSEIARQLKKMKPIEDMPTNNVVFSQIRSDTQSIKTYIQQLIDLEIAEHFLIEHIVALDAELSIISKSKICAYAANQKEESTNNSKLEKSMLAEIAKLQKDFDKTDWVGKVNRKKIAKPSPPEYFPEIAPVKPTEPVLKRPLFFNKNKVLAENERMTTVYKQALANYEHNLQKLQETKSQNAALRAQYDAELREYHEKVEQENQRVAEKQKLLEAEGELRKQEAKIALTERINEINRQIQDLNKPYEPETVDNPIENALSKEKDACLTLVKAVWKAKGKLYSINVIYPNYRDIFALSAFYDYFNSERCYEFEGSNGAYNLYEAERRSDVVATLLCKLEDINKNQIYLYQKSSAMFDNLKNLKDALTKAIKNAKPKGDQEVENVPPDSITEEAFKAYYKKSDKIKQTINQSVVTATDLYRA